MPKLLVYEPLRGMREEKINYKPILKRFAPWIALGALVGGIGFVYELNKISKSNQQKYQLVNIQPKIQSKKIGNLENKVIKLANPKIHTTDLSVQIDGKERILVYNSKENHYEFKK